MIKPMDVTPEITEALARLRAWDHTPEIREALDALDNAGVFAEIDEANDYASAEEILAESAVEASRKLTNYTEPDPAEWGDVKRIDLARHQGAAPVDEPLYGSAAETVGQQVRRMSGADEYRH